MSPCPPLIITMVCPWLINHLSDPWNFDKSNGILLRSNWRKPYPKFYGSEFYGSGCVYLGVVKKTSQKVPTYLPGGGGLLIRCWHYKLYIGKWPHIATNIGVFSPETRPCAFRLRIWKFQPFEEGIIFRPLRCVKSWQTPPCFFAQWFCRLLGFSDVPD